jgi:hypothetical protein
MSDELKGNIKGVFEDLDDGGLGDAEALAKIRDLVGAGRRLPDKVVLLGTLPFTITMDTRTREVIEFEINFDFPNFERAAETRYTGESINYAEFQEEIDALIEVADDDTGSWPDPERM